MLCDVMCYVMLCYVMCYVMLCYVMCYVMLCDVMLCYVMSCYVVLYRVYQLYKAIFTANIHHLHISGTKITSAGAQFGTESGRFLPCQLSFFAGGAVTGGLVDVGGANGEFWGAIC